MSALHITNGDATADTLRKFISGRIVKSADPLHDGAAPALDDERWYEVRARFLADRPDQVDTIARDLAAADRVVDGAFEYNEVVLWFEHDLFDQLNLVRTLDRIGRLSRRPGRTALICIDRFEGVDRFIGLGQLELSQLSTLVDRKQVVSDRQFDLAARAWNAFRLQDPHDLMRIASDPDDSLPFLGPALRRFLADYPAAANGLSLTAHRALDTVRAEAVDARITFARAQLLEDSPFRGDWSFYRIVRALASARSPLVRIDPDDSAVDLRGHVISLTEAGLQVLAAERDAIALNGIDEWHGGVHLEGEANSPWRWDASRRTLVSW